MHVALLAQRQEVDCSKARDVQHKVFLPGALQTHEATMLGFLLDLQN